MVVAMSTFSSVSKLESIACQRYIALEARRHQLVARIYLIAPATGAFNFAVSFGYCCSFCIT